MPVGKLDLRKALKPLFSPPARDVQLIKIPPMKYIMVDGKGEPGGESFQQAIGAIYNVAYTMKFRSKKLLKKDYNVMALEGLWWMKGKIDMEKRGDWLWTLMVVVPDFITPKMFADSVEEVKERKNPPGVDSVRMETFDEGLCVQTMHIGPYSTEPESIARLDAYSKEHGYRMVGKHHEIYFGDPRRSAPSKLRTIIRHPVEKQA